LPARSMPRACQVQKGVAGSSQEQPWRGATRSNQHTSKYVSKYRRSISGDARGSPVLLHLNLVRCDQPRSSQYQLLAARSMPRSCQVQKGAAGSSQGAGRSSQEQPGSSNGAARNSQEQPTHQQICIQILTKHQWGSEQFPSTAPSDFSTL
jgi:hypothetical protein